MVCQERILRNFSVQVPVDDFVAVDHCSIVVLEWRRRCRRQRRFSAFLIWLCALPDASVTVHAPEMAEWRYADTSRIVTIGAGHPLQSPDRRPQKHNSASEKDGNYNSIEALGKRLEEPRRDAYTCKTT
jgi:hypothetical protein